MPEVKSAPNSKESEMMVLGCMLSTTQGLNAGADGLDEADFYYTEHRAIFSALQEFWRTDKPADVHLVCEELKRQGKLKAVGGAAYVTTLAQYAGTSAYVEEYVNIVSSKALLRRMIDAAQVVEKKALDEPPNVHEALDEAQQLFFRISQAASPMAGKLLRDILAGAHTEPQEPFLQALEQRQENYIEKGPDAGGITGIPTGYIDLDKTIDGMGKSNLLILAGRPAMGKTALAINVAENVCFRNGKPVGIFSLEMTAEQLVHRVVSSQAQVEAEKIRNGSLGGGEYQRIVAAVSEMQNHTMVIDDQPGLRINDLRARARRMKEAYGIELLVIDYLQLLSGSASKRNDESRQNEISEISRNLKNLARELNIPILCLSQLSRKVEERTGHRPVLSDLRESGCLTGDTLITHADTGKRYTIRELAERKEQTPFPVWAVEDKWKVGRHLMTKAFHSGKKRVYELRTCSGRRIKASANHPFLKLGGWHALEKLSIGDCIALPRALKATEPQCPMDDDELILLAHLLGDGCILPKQPHHYTSADPENIVCVGSAAKRLFQIESRVVRQKNWEHIYLTSPTPTSRTTRHPITDWYAKLGIERCRSYDKRIPEALFEMDERAIRLFLHHLWATDGAINRKRLKGRKPSASIYYASTSETLILQVQSLLLRVGIWSTATAIKPKGNYRPSHHLLIQGTDNQLRFLREIGSHGKRGEIIPELIAALEEINQNPNTDAIPREAWFAVVEPEKNRMEMGWRDVCKGINTSYCGSTLMKHGISRCRMSTLAEALGRSEPLLNLANSDVYWDKIIEIKELGVEEVYDATVPGVHNFVANDIIVHNSLEQDADVVMMILRRDYYDPLDKPGMAEVIVAKNRHGAVGNVQMTYRKEIVRFEDYAPASFEPTPA